MSLEKCVVVTMMTFGLCLLGAYAFIGLPWLVLMAFTLFCCRVVHECLRLKYPPQQCVKDYAVESAILPRERLDGLSNLIGSSKSATSSSPAQVLRVIALETLFRSDMQDCLDFKFILHRCSRFCCSRFCSAKVSNLISPKVFSCPGSTVIRFHASRCYFVRNVVRTSVHSFFGQVSFRVLSLSLFGTSSVRNRLALVQLYLSSWGGSLPGWDGLCMTLESRLPAAT